MSLRLEMLQVARLAPSLLGDDAVELVYEFVRGTQCTDGGYADRDGQADLYYTSFAIDTLTALQRELPEDSLQAFLQSQFARLVSLDFVHLCCLARCWSALEVKPEPEMLAAIFREIESYRSSEGGYNQAKGSDGGSAYACFLAFGAYSDHGLSVPRVDGVVRCLDSLKTGDGAWANDASLPVPNIPSTAAAVTLCRNLRQPIPPETPQWILESLQPGGGFLAFPLAPIPDLLSTAVALHALDGLQVSFEHHKESLLDFIDTLWTAAGGFHGNWEDDDLDIEYTYYGLLALGHLAL